MPVISICGVILASQEPEQLAAFYTAALGIKFEREEHGGLLPHFGADIGQVHFGIHPPENLKPQSAGNSPHAVAFNVDDLHQVLTTLRSLNAVEIIAPRDEGFGIVATYADPDGNLFEVVELRYEFGA